MAETERLFGRIDVLVNAGATTDRGTILTTTPELFDRMFAINVRGPYFLMQEAIRLMIREGHRGSDRQHRLDFGTCRASPSSAPIVRPRAHCRP